MTDRVENLCARFITKTFTISKNTDACLSRSVRTLTSDDLEYVHENGRTYGNDTYFLPCVYKPNNDFIEQDRLSLQHQIFVQALRGRLTTTKLLPSTRRILDLGTGPGQWAVSMADQYPHAEVVGIDMIEWDIDTTEATLVDSKVTWELDDLDVWGRETDDDLVDRIASIDFMTEMTYRNPIASPKKPTSTAQLAQSALEEPLTVDLSILKPRPEPGWHFSDSFELIHMRSMKGTFTHWEDVYAEIYKSLSPGGWIEVADWDLGSVPLGPEHTKDPANLPMPTLRKLWAGAMEASFRSGRPLGLYYMNPSYLEEAGFEDIQTTHVNVPVGQWSDDEAQKSIGKMLFVLGMETFEPLCLRLLTKWGSKERVWTAEEVKADCQRAQEEVRDWVEKSERGEVEGWCASFKWITARKSWHAEK
jgi:SAM-dependent methyltransferase